MGGGGGDYIKRFQLGFVNFRPAKAIVIASARHVIASTQHVIASAQQNYL